MPSLDIVSKVDVQDLDNAINVAKREILNRFDFRDSKSSIELDKKAMTVHIVSENEMRLNAITDSIRKRMIKQKMDPLCLDFQKEQYASGDMLRKDVLIKQGIEKEIAKKITKSVKESKLKVQAQIMDDIVRLSGKKIDDLRTAMDIVNKAGLGIPLQFVNMK